MITLVRKATEDPILAVADRLHGRMKKAVLDAIDTMKGSVNLKALADAISANDFNQALAVLGVDTGFARVLQGHGVEAGIKSVRDAIQDVYQAGAKAAIDTLPEKAALEGSFDLLNPKSIDFLQNYSFDLIQQISEEARGTVRQTLLRAFKEGGHPTQQAREIREAIGLTQNQEKAVDNYRAALENQKYADALQRALRDGRYDAGVLNAQRAGKALNQARVDKMVDRYRERYVNYRANTIARTETIRAANAGQQEIWRQAAEQGVIDHETVERVWISSGDDNTCDECDDLDGETAELGEEFMPGVFHPPLHPNCRCTTALQFNVDKRDRVAKVEVLPPLYPKRDRVRKYSQNRVDRDLRTVSVYTLDHVQKYSEDQPRDEHGRFAGSGAEPMGAPRGVQTYRAPAEPEKPFESPLPKDADHRWIAERVIEEGREFMAKVPGFTDARERAQWAKNQLNRVEAKMRTAQRAMDKHWELPQEQRSSPEAISKYSQASKEMDTMVQRASIGQNRLREAETDVRDKLGEWLKGASGDIRPVNANITGFDPVTTGKIADAIHKFELLTGGASGKDNTVNVRPLPHDDEGRARYSMRTRTVWLKPGEIRERTIVHEMGHWFEHNSDETQANIYSWMKYRTSGESLKKLDDIHPGIGYKQDEVTREDKFMNPYIGRDYGYGASEVASMGFEYMFRKAGEFYNRDPDHFMFTAGLISKAARRMKEE